MKRTLKQHILGDWTVTNWLYAIAGLLCGFALLTVLAEAIYG